LLAGPWWRSLKVAALFLLSERVATDFFYNAMCPC
jgi:hypothetical protein